jgi:hypothetical protein
MSDRAFNWIASACALAALLAVFWGMYILASASCAARWEESGLGYRFSVLGNCQVMDGGVWIPASNYRRM